MEPLECDICKKMFTPNADCNFKRDHKCSRDYNDSYGFGFDRKQREQTGFYDALPENMYEGYDFGGWEAPFHPGLTIIDLPSTPTGDTGPVSPEFAHETYIDGDLTTPLSLSPKPFINISNVLGQTNNWGDMTGEEWDKDQLQIADNINKALLPGGKVRLVESIENLQPVLDPLYNLGYKKVWDHIEKESGAWDENDNQIPVHEIILQKPV